MNILKEFIDPEMARLSDLQKTVLATCFHAPNPKMAFDTCIGTEKIVSARNSLKVLGFISLSNAEIHVTDRGKRALVTNNLVDDMDNLTEDGEKAVEKFEQYKLQMNENSVLINYL